METHVNVIAILWIISGVFGFFIAIGIFLILFGISFIPDMGYEAPVILRIVAISGSLFIAAFSIPELIGGIGLLKKQEWARILVLIVSILNLIWFPFWTALGVYSIVVLFKDETAQLFRA